MSDINNASVKRLIDNNIPMVDSNDDLRIYCYRKTNKIDEFHNLRGIVLDNNNNVIVRGLPYCTELTAVNLLDLADKIDITTTKIYNSYEGTIIRVFFHNEKWYTSTNRRLNAFESKWAAKHITFGKTFTFALRKHFPTLSKEYENNVEFLESVYNGYMDKQNVYMFLIQPSIEERIVISGGTNIVWHIQTSRNQEITDDLFYNEKSECLSSVQIHTTDWDEINNVVMNTDKNVSQGLLLITSSDEYIKVYNNDYDYFQRLRGNVPSIKFRYLNLKGEDNSDDIIADYKDLYPEFDWETLDRNINQICSILHDLYLKKYIQKVNIRDMLNHEYDMALRYYLHAYYRETRHPVTVPVVEYILNHEPVLTNSLLKRFTTIKQDLEREKEPV